MTTQVYTTQAEQLAGFVVRTYYDELSLAARLQLKIRTLAAWLLPRCCSASSCSGSTQRR